MAAQNARLVVGYCAKKAELKRMQEALAAERTRWEVALIPPLAFKAILRLCQSHKHLLPELICSRQSGSRRDAAMQRA